jgi:hypothetical protein
MNPIKRITKVKLAIADAIYLISNTVPLALMSETGSDLNFASGCRKEGNNYENNFIF